MEPDAAEQASRENFEGHPGRICGEHRTVGSRAWCFDCSEWCYPKMPCVRCELPHLQAELATLRARLAARPSEEVLKLADELAHRVTVMEADHSLKYPLDILIRDSKVVSEAVNAYLTARLALRTTKEGEDDAP